MQKKDNIPEYNEETVSAMILRANEPPNYDGGFTQVMKQIRARKFYAKQFQAIQEQTKMGKTLYFSDVSPTFYETNYHRFAQNTSVNRVRACLAIGIISMASLYGEEYLSGKWDANTDLGRTEEDKTLLLYMTLGGIIAPACLALLLTFTAFGRRNLENITLLIFILTALVMIMKKPIEKFKGPVIPLLILLIPIFGITRMRFLKSCILGWCIFLLYFITMGVARQIPSIIKKPEAFDDYTNISYQSINYGISVIGGMVSQYRQELLRRRNFCLQLPFSGTMDKEAIEELNNKKYSTSELMHKWSQSFRHLEVEHCFYKFWYLIDPFPYDNPNSGTLHAGVFRTIRFAVITLLLNQFVLLLQDLKFLVFKPDPYVEKWDILYALITRYGVTVPLYLSAAGFMYIVGNAFFERWVKEAEELKNKCLGMESEINISISDDSSELNLDNRGNTSNNVSQSPLNGKAAAKNMPSPIAPGVSNRFRRVVEVVQFRRMASVVSRERLMDVILRQNGGYVHSAQLFSSFVIASHVFCMGFLLLLISHEHSPKPLYFMGFLNAILFAHRSGFRARFIYATWTTLFVALVICVLAIWKAPDQVQAYSAYVVVIISLGMMISYEEENLRRTFFVLKSIRTLEFQEWFGAVLKVQGYVRAHCQRKLKALRSKKSSLSGEEANAAAEKSQAEIVIVNTSAQMAMASRIGMYSQMVNICIALVDVLTTALA